jgi:hypothetical protein
VPVPNFVIKIKSSQKGIPLFINLFQDRARIRVEHIIREDYLVEGLEITEMFLDLLLARVGLINISNDLDPGLAEAISSVIWVQPRIVTECGELSIIVNEFGKKYGKVNFSFKQDEP